MNKDILNKQLIGSIFSQQDISNFKYDLIQYEADLSKLSLKKFYTSINFYGTSSLLVFTKVNNKHYCFTVERQTLSYNFNKIDYNKVKLDMRNIRLDYDIYQGTIFDGILVKTSNKDDLFIISDVYTFRGINYTKTRLDEKLKIVIDYLKENYSEDHLENNIKLTINRIFPIDKTTHVVNKILPEIKDLKYRGLCFYPEYSETKLIFMFNNNQDKQDKKDSHPMQQRNKYISQDKYTNQDKYINPRYNLQEIKNNNDNKRDKEIKKENISDNNKIITTPHENKYSDKNQSKYRYINTSGQDIFATLEVKPTGNVDVYKVNSVERTIIEGKKILKRIQMGIAYINKIQQSHKLRELFNNKSSLLMKCKFNDDKSKWEPLEIDSNAKHPTFINDIDLEMMELSDSED
jgi:hypothetical protein